MLDIKKIAENKPHLKETLGFYEKVAEFIKTVSNINTSPIGLEDKAYPLELINPVFDSFTSIFDVPEDILVPLKEAMRLNQIDFTRLPLNEIPSFSLPYHEDELRMILFIISKPYFIFLKKSYNLNNISWQEGRCPICHSQPVMASINKDGQRQLHCSFCGTVGYYKRIGCPVCLNDDTSKINIILIDGEEDFRIDTCDNCFSYIKTFQIRLLSNLNPDLADIVSLPLDVISQSKGYRRLSPNPIGMIRMT